MNPLLISEDSESLKYQLPNYEIFRELPVDIWDGIFELFSPFELAPLSLVCKVWYMRAHERMITQSAEVEWVVHEYTSCPVRSSKSERLCQTVPWACGQQLWRMYILHERESLGCYVQICHEYRLPPDWLFCAEFTIHVRNSIEPKKTVSKSTHWKYKHTTMRSRGIGSLIPRAQLILEPGWLVNDCLRVGVSFRVLDEDTYDRMYPIG